MKKWIREVKPDGSFEETLTESQCSIQISKNAKGDVAYEVKVYEDDGTIAAAKLLAYTTIAENQKSALLGK